MSESQDVSTKNADAKGRRKLYEFKLGKVFFQRSKCPYFSVSAVFETRLRTHFIRSFTVIAKKGLAYTL